MPVQSQSRRRWRSRGRVVEPGTSGWQSCCGGGWCVHGLLAWRLYVFGQRGAGRRPGGKLIEDVNRRKRGCGRCSIGRAPRDGSGERGRVWSTVRGWDDRRRCDQKMKLLFEFVVGCAAIEQVGSDRDGGSTFFGIGREVAVQKQRGVGAWS